jgi:hypothetical protein
VAVGLAVSLVFASVGVTICSLDQGFRGRAERHGARVVGNVYEARSYHPVVEFRDGQGQPVRVTSKLGFDAGGGPMYAAGEAVTVLYDPKDPAATRIESLFHRYGVPVLCSLGALLALAFFVARPFRAPGPRGPDPEPAA